MKYFLLFSLLLLSRPGWANKFITACEGGRGEYEQMKYDVENDEGYSRQYQANAHYLLALCQLAHEDDPEGALKNLEESSELGDMAANFLLGEYYMLGGWGQNPSRKNQQEAVWEFEKTLLKLGRVMPNYPLDFAMAEEEITQQIYPVTLFYLMRAYTVTYLNEGFAYYKNNSPQHYPQTGQNDKMERDRKNKEILGKMEYHIQTCLVDRQSSLIVQRTRQMNSGEHVISRIPEYEDLWSTMKTGLCPLFKEFLEEARKREAELHRIALNCVINREKVTEDHLHCEDIKTEAKEFDSFLKEWFPRYNDLDFTRKSEAS